MRPRRLVPAVGAVLTLIAAAVPVAGQRSVGVSTLFQGYSFEDGLGAKAAQLLMAPIAIRLPLGDRFTLDFYGAWAQGKVEIDDVEFELNGLVDSQVKASYRAASGVLLSVGANLPSGNGTHDSEEAVVAAVLSTDLLGFREATFGTGFGITSSLATATRVGSWGVGLAGSYAVRNEFEPRADTALGYTPGNEVRVRLGVDRNVGSSGTFTAGATYQAYDQDQVNGKNLFQAGNRIQGDATFQFRAGSGVWTLYASNLWRDHGDLTLDIIDATGAVVGDTTFVTSAQNLFLAGASGSLGSFQPHVDFRLQTRDEGGSDQGSGWMIAAGGDLPLRVFGGTDFFPRVRATVGSVNDAVGVGRRVLGLDVGGTLRWSF